MLEVKDIGFSYIPREPVFKNVSFTVDEGEFIAIGGRNGCGKTTVTRILVGLETADEGEIFYLGTNISAMPPSERGKFIGYVFQKPDRQMFRNTVEEEISFGPEQLGYTPEECRQIVAEVMKKTGISHLSKSYPLSLRRGEKQRVAIASALAMRSKILILDEPTSGQDGKETAELMELLVELHREGLSIILVTHDMELMAEFCTRVIVIGYGTKAFDGTPQELFTNRDDLEELGLSRPPCVELSLGVSGLGYCASMKAFEKALLQRRGEE